MLTFHNIDTRMVAWTLEPQWVSLSQCIAPYEQYDAKRERYPHIMHVRVRYLTNKDEAKTILIRLAVKIRIIKPLMPPGEASQC